MLTAEKRADSVIRWLERMKKSYSSGRIETALMDAECARADLEDLRDNVFARLTDTHRTERSALVVFLRSVFLALLIVMAAVMPLSREAPVIVPIVHETVAMAIPETVLSPSLQPDSKPKITRKVTAGGQPQKRQQNVKTVKPKVQQKPSTPLTKTVAYDKLTSLVKTGQKAFNNKIK